MVGGTDLVRAYDLATDGGSVTYHGCTTAGSKSGKAWCATTASYDADGLFGLCFEHGCPEPKRVHREAWRPLGQTLVGTAAGDRFGYAVSGTTEWRHIELSNREYHPLQKWPRLAVGAPGGAGRVHTYQYNPNLFPAIPPATLACAGAHAGNAHAIETVLYSAWTHGLRPDKGWAFRARVLVGAPATSGTLFEDAGFAELRWSADAHTDFVWTVDCNALHLRWEGFGVGTAYDVFLSYDATSHRYVADATSPDAADFLVMRREVHVAGATTNYGEWERLAVTSIQDGLNGGVAANAWNARLGGASAGLLLPGASVNAALELQDVALYDEPFRKGGWVEFKKGTGATTEFPTGEGRGHSVSLSDDGVHMAYGVHQADHGSHTDAGVVRLYYAANPHGNQTAWPTYGWSSSSPGSIAYGAVEDAQSGYTTLLSGSGDRMAAGVPGHDRNLGYVTVWARDVTREYNSARWLPRHQPLGGHDLIMERYLDNAGTSTKTERVLEQFQADWRTDFSIEFQFYGYNHKEQYALSYVHEGDGEAGDFEIVFVVGKDDDINTVAVMTQRPGEATQTPRIEAHIVHASSLFDTQWHTIKMDFVAYTEDAGTSPDLADISVWIDGTEYPAEGDATPTPWTRQYFVEDQTSSLTVTTGLEPLHIFRPDKSWTIVVRYTPGGGNCYNQFFRLVGMGNYQRPGDAYLEMYGGWVYLQWEHRNVDTWPNPTWPNSGGGKEHLKLQPDYAVNLDGSKTYEIAITYDATPFNDGPLTHPDIPPDGSSQEGYALQMRIREEGESVWQLPVMHTTANDNWDNSPALEPTSEYTQMQLLSQNCGTLKRVALYDSALPVTDLDSDSSSSTGPDDLEAIEWTPNAEASSRLITCGSAHFANANCDGGQVRNVMLTMGTPRRDQGVGHAVALNARGDVVAVGASSGLLRAV